MGAVIEDYLTKDEEVKLRWQGGLKTEDDSQSLKKQLDASDSSTIFSATDKRLLYLANTGFKDIDYAHISSVEVDKSTSPDLTPLQTLAAIGIIIGGIGILALFAGEIAMGVIGALVGGAMFGGAWTKVESPGELFDYAEKTIFEVKIITGNEAHQQIEFETEDNVGADLSRIVREYS